MYIVTTSKRIHQITALVFLCLAIIAVFSIYRHYTRFYAQPGALFEQLVSVSGGQAALSLEYLDVEQLTQEAISQTRASLVESLSKSEIPDAEQSADLLLPQATAFLEGEDQLLVWLEQRLQLLSFPSKKLSWKSADLERKTWQGPNGCLVIERQEAQWRLTSIVQCQ